MRFKKTLASRGILALLFVTIIAPYIVGPSMASDSAGWLGISEFHTCDVPGDTVFVGSEVRDLYYAVQTKVYPEVGTLDSVELNLTGISDWPDFSPAPTSTGFDWAYWDIGNLAEGNQFWGFWTDPGRICSESLDFSVSRIVEPNTIPEGTDSIVQTVSIEVRPSVQDRCLYIFGSSYAQSLVQSEFIDCNYKENLISCSDDEGPFWIINPPLQEVYTFWMSYALSRKAGVVGAVKVFPETGVCARAATHYQSSGNVLSQPIEIGTVEVSTQNMVNWNINNETAKDLRFERLEQASPVQDMSQMNVATMENGGPLTLDPARAYDTASMELLYNVYEPLVFFDKEKMNQFVPVLATSWTVSPDGLTYTFKIRGTDGSEPPVKFHDGHLLTTEDVEYSFERLMIIEGGPAWMIYEPLLDCLGSRDEFGNVFITAEQIDDAITHNDTIVTFHLARPYPPFLQILSQPWSSILSKEWCRQIGDWPGTWDNWTLYNNPEWSAIEMQNTEAPGPHLNAICGTGPYYLEYFDQSFQEWMIRKFDDYWRGWPVTGTRSFVESARMTWRYNWEDRRDKFLAGEFDSINVPATVTGEVLGQPGVRCIYPLPQLTCSGMLFNFQIDPSSPFIGSGSLDGQGIPPNFFADIDVRKGFAYSINYTQLINEAFSGEAEQPATPVIKGLPFYNPDQEKYAINLTKAREHFEKPYNGQLWTTGFNMTVCYIEGNLLQQKLFEMIKTNVETLNPLFHINIQSMYPGEYNPYVRPIINMGWAADFSDPHNFLYAFAHSRGNAGQRTHYQNATLDALIDEGMRTFDVDQRRQVYYEIQSIYHNECPGVPLAQSTARRFEHDWVQGWYYNPLLYTGNYFYTQWKESISQEVTPGNNTIDEVATSDTLILMNTTAPGEVTVSMHDLQIEGTIPNDVVNMKCVTVDTTLAPENITWPIEIRIYYTDEEIISAYVEQSTLKMYYWNETTNEWILEENSGWVQPSDIDGYVGYVWARIYHLSLFTAMGQRRAAPNVNPIQAPIAPVRMGTEITATATFTGFFLDTHTATWNWADGSTSLGAVEEAGGSGTVSGSHIYTAPGVYTITLTVTNDRGDRGSIYFEYVVVYDPQGGFVTGGGWIMSPQGAYTLDPLLTGKATFGFVSKYNKGATIPSGKTEFIFHVAGMKFQSSTYDWLVVAGARAQYKGSGTIKGGGNYGFILTATDGQISGGGGIDRFRIKIWDKTTGTVIYDNQLGQPDNANASQLIADGSIVIHKG